MTPTTPKTATKTNLDNALAYANIRRIPASRTYTALEVTGTVGTVITGGHYHRRCHL